MIFRKLLWVLLGTVACLCPVQSVKAQDESGDELVQMIVDLLHEEDKEMRSLALEQVRTQCPGSSATERFAAELAGLSVEAKAGLISALGDRGDKAAKNAIIGLLETGDDETVKLAAISALSQLGDSADTQRFVSLLREGSDAEKEAARKSLVRLRGEQAAASIAVALSAAADPLKVTLIDILTERRALDTIPTIVQSVTADDPYVRVAAMKFLGELGGPDEISAMVQGILKAERGRERDHAEKSVLAVCNRIDDREQRAAPLLDAIEGLTDSQKLAMMPALGRVGGPEALQVIEQAIASQDPQVHDVGIRALGNWPDASIAPRLKEIAQSGEHGSHKLVALRALIRVAPLSDDRTDDERLALLREAMDLCERDDERKLVIDRARTIRTMDSLRYVLPFTNDPKFAEQACLSIVEMAHHRDLRTPNEEEFALALDKVLAVSKDAVVRERAELYKQNETWYRPPKPEAPIVVAHRKSSEQSRQAEAAEVAASVEEAAEGDAQPSRIAIVLIGIGIIALVVFGLVLMRR